MNLHEYQAKALFEEFGITIPRSRVARTVAEAVAGAKFLGGTRWMVKAQVHAGERLKSGGVKCAENITGVRDHARQLLGSYLVTGQTRKHEMPVDALLIEEVLPVVDEIYLSISIDRSRRRIVFTGTASGGVNIEQTATAELSGTVAVAPAAGLQNYQCRQLVSDLGLEFQTLEQLTSIMMGLYRLLLARDLNLIEINPLCLTDKQLLVAADAKIIVDDNALYRQSALAMMRDPRQEDERESQAREHGLNYVALNGNIACIVNGAGLAMATMDIIKLHGGEPANFLDIGGEATPDKVAAAFGLILSEGGVKAILVNVFGGIVRCDLVAEGIVLAVAEIGQSVPVVVRLQGTNVERARQLLLDSAPNISIVDDLTAAAKQAVAAARI